MMSKLTFNTSRPLDWKSWPTNWMCISVESLLTVIDRLHGSRPFDHLRGNAVHRAADVARGRVEEHVAVDRIGDRELRVVPPVTLWVSM